jgi:hypothetical protein
MLGSIHFMKYGAGNMAAAIMLLLGTSAESHAQTGTVHFTVVNAGFIVSTGSGTGTLSVMARNIGASICAKCGRLPTGAFKPMEHKFFRRAMEGDGDCQAAVVYLKTEERRSVLAGTNMPQSHVVQLTATAAPQQPTSTDRIRQAIDRLRASRPQQDKDNGEASQPH